LQQGDVLLLLLFDFDSEYDVMEVTAKQKGLKLNGTSDPGLF